MKLLYNVSAKRKVVWFSFAIVIIVVLLNIFGYVYDVKAISTLAAYKEIDKYQVISELLMDATNYVGTCNPTQAANVWAEGLRRRSGAMQYSVMTTTLKEQYSKILDKNFPNWVTGMSSPWIDKYEIVENKEVNNTYIIKLKFYTITSTGPYNNYFANIEVIQQDGFWRISKINTDDGLKYYTGLLLL